MTEPPGPANLLVRNIGQLVTCNEYRHPSYLAKIAAFVHETWLSSTRQAEERVEALCKVFFEEKPYLLERWTTGVLAETAFSLGGTT